MTTLHALQTAETTDFIPMPFGDTWSLDADVARRVAYGAALLDTAVPGWAWKISPRSLRVDSYRECLLGQLYGTYDVGLERLDVHGGPCLLGFDAKNCQNQLEWCLLRKYWIEAVLERVIH